MATLPAFDDLFDAGEREALVLPSRFNPAIIRTPGSDVNIAFNVSAAMGQELSAFVQAAINETFLSTAAQIGGDVLDRWVYDRYGIVRQDARSAVVPVTFARTRLTPGVTLATGSVVGTTDGTNFQIVNDVVFAPNVIGPLTVAAVAEQTGTGGNVATGTITQLVSSFDDDTITVINNEPAAGGREAETDSELEARARDFFTNARRGTRTAILTGARDTPGVTQASAIEFLDSDGRAAGRVQVIISDENGNSNSALALDVLENLDDFRCLGVPVTVLAGTPQFVEIVVSGLQFAANANTTNVLQEGREAILAAVNILQPGETLRLATISTALDGTEDLIVPSGSIREPAGDLVPQTGGVIRTTLDRIRLNNT